MNFFNNLMGAVAPAVTGFVVGATNSFSMRLPGRGIVLLIGIFSFVVVLGRIEPIPEPADADPAPLPAHDGRDPEMGKLAHERTRPSATGAGAHGRVRQRENHCRRTAHITSRLGDGGGRSDCTRRRMSRKCGRGIPLDDADRAPWLDRIGEHLRAWAAAGRSGVLTCSALKRAYRARILSARPDVRFVYLKGSERLIQGRVSVRHHEYMPASLLRSQFETLEEPLPSEPVTTIDAGDPPEVEVQKIIDALCLSSAGSDPTPGR